MKMINMLPILLLPLVVFANSQVEQKPHDFLSGGFNQQPVTKCQRLISICPKQGPFAKPACLKAVVTKHHCCSQLVKLADSLGTPVNTISAQRVNDLVLVTKHFVADGQQQYYIVTPNGELIDTQIDPRQLDDSIKQRYQRTDWLVSNETRPNYLYQHDGSSQVTVLLRLNKGCVSCSALAWATLHFYFAKDGSFKQVRLASFITE